MPVDSGQAADRARAGSGVVGLAVVSGYSEGAHCTRLLALAPVPNPGQDQAAEQHMHCEGGGRRSRAEGHHILAADKARTEGAKGSWEDRVQQYFPQEQHLGEEDYAPDREGKDRVGNSHNRMEGRNRMDKIHRRILDRASQQVAEVVGTERHAAAGTAIHGGAAGEEEDVRSGEGADEDEVVESDERLPEVVLVLAPRVEPERGREQGRDRQGEPGQQPEPGLGSGEQALAEVPRPFAFVQLSIERPTWTEHPFLSPLAGPVVPNPLWKYRV